MTKYRARYSKDTWGSMKFEADSIKEAEEIANRDYNGDNIIEDSPDDFAIFEGWTFYDVEEVEEE